MLASTSKRSGALLLRDGLGSESSISESAAGCGVCGLQVEGSSGEGRALPAATAAAARHFPRLERQLAHFGPASEQIPSFGGLPLRFIGAQRLRSCRSPAHGSASHARDNRNFKRRAGKRRSHIPKIGGIAPVTLRHSALFSRTPFPNTALGSDGQGPKGFSFVFSMFLDFCSRFRSSY